MTVHRVEIGIVGADRQLVDFYAEVFELGELDSTDYGKGTLYRLDLNGTILKVNVPSTRPEPAPRRESMLAVTGVRYLTIAVDDVDAYADRVAARGGRVVVGPRDEASNLRLAVVEDPEGNTLELKQTS